MNPSVPRPNRSRVFRAAWLPALVGAALLAACGGESAPGTSAAPAQGAAESRARALGVTLNPAGWVAVPERPDPLMQGLAIPADAPTRGMWSRVGTWPINGLHQAVLPDGRVLTWGTGPNGDPHDGRWFVVWDPSRGLFDPGAFTTDYDPSRQDSFCAASAYLPDGRLMITGGNGNQTNTTYTPANGARAMAGPVADQRWYATMVTLADGRPMVLGGINPYTEGQLFDVGGALARGESSMTPEVYENGAWRTLFGAESRAAWGPDFLRASMPKAWLAPDGRVFGISTDQVWYVDPNANGGNGATTIVGGWKGPPQGGASNDNAPNVGPTSTGVMFAPGRVLILGGNSYQNGSGFAGSRQATVVDINGGGAVRTEQPPMAFGRNLANVTVLPDGRVLATGGETRANNDPGFGVYAAELWNPATGGWTTMASSTVFRGYHSQAGLLLNGTVLNTGGGAPGPVQLRGDVFYPPYLFRPAGGGAELAPRPRLLGLSGLNQAHGGQMQIDMAGNEAIAQVVLVGLSVGTHAFNAGQRRIPLTFTQEQFRLTATLPGNTVAPPGYYQVVAINAAGVPSAGTVIAVGQGVAAPAVPFAPYTPPTVGGGGGGGAPTLPALNGTGSGLTAAYFANRFLADAPVLTRNEVPWFDWGDSAPAGAVPADNFSVRWSGQIQAVQAGSYQFRTRSDDGIRLWVNGTQLINNWSEHPPTDDTSGAITLAAGQQVPIVIEYFEGGGGATLQLSWQRPGGAWEPVPASQLYPSAAVTPTPPPPPAPPAPPPTVPVQPGPVTVPPITIQPVNAGAMATFSVPAEAGVSYRWDFGDGSPPTAFSPTATVTKVFAAPGVYGVTLTARSSSGATGTRTILQAVGTPATSARPTASSAMALEPRAGAAARLWVVNPDSNSVVVLDSANLARVAEVRVGTAPRSVAVAPDGQVWVTNKGSSNISIISPTSLGVVATVALPRASQPHGLVFAPGGSAFVVLEARGELLKLDPVSRAVQGTLAVGANPRHVSASANGALVLVSRFITNPLPGEATAAVDTSAAGAEVLAVNAGPMTLNRTIVLRHSDKVDNENQGAGIPNYLAAAVISPDGARAWVPSKQDNIRRGALRNRQPLNFQNTVRAISSRIDMATLTEDLASRVDHDNASLGSAGAYHPSGAYLFVALETSRQVAVVDAYRGRELAKFDVGRAPQALAVSADGTRLYVQNYMDRNLSVIDLGPLATRGLLEFPVVANPATVIDEPLSPQVLQGKRLFYDARDPRLARDSYMSCASCHSDGGHDGRTWDFTSLGEGLRNTPPLTGRAGIGQGFQHWSANFDEVQDFEGQIRTLAGGTGLMSDAQFNTGTRNTPLGDRKAGLSADLDALAAYLASLTSFDSSPARNADGTLSAAGLAGRAVFANAGCASCHGGAGFTSSADAGALRSIGTIKATSGQRLGAALNGIDVPTLRDVWKTAPYLHDGSAPTLAAAVQAHAGNTVVGADLNNLVAYLQQIDRDEPAPSGQAPAPLPSPPGMGSGLSASYFGNPDLAGTPVLTRTEVPWFDWGIGAPAAGVGPDNFSVRWSGEVQAVEAGAYQFRTLSDDGVRVWVNGVQLINNWTAHAPMVDTSPAITLAAGQRVPIVVEFNEYGGGAVLQLSWLRPGAAWAAVPAGQLYPAASANPPPVAANQAPTVTVAVPASAVQGVAVSVTATAADVDGSVGRVEFYSGSTLLGTDTTAPYGLSWTPPAAGTYLVTARAFDNLGAATTSAAAVLTVTAPATADTWVRCAGLFGACSVPSATSVRYVDPARNLSGTTNVSIVTFCIPQIFGLPWYDGAAGYCEYRRP